MLFVGKKDIRLSWISVSVSGIYWSVESWVRFFSQYLIYFILMFSAGNGSVIKMMESCVDNMCLMSRWLYEGKNSTKTASVIQKKSHFMMLRSFGLAKQRSIHVVTKL